MNKIIMCLSMAIVFAGCELDNYEMPDLTLSGSVVDAETGELVESGGINGGTIVQLYEYSDSQPQNLVTYPDGTFVNSRVFAGDYTYTAVGPFTPVNPERVALAMRGDTEVEIEVTPHVRVWISDIAVNGTTATVKVAYEKVNDAQILSRIGIAWNTYEHPNILSVGANKFQEEQVEAEGLLSGERTYTITGLVSGEINYIRAFARTNNPGNYYNYSPQKIQPVN
ncbi:DUF3823 domain-containing protein [Parapedobacter sp. DT-150]|uniref:DUF3823 domain-containing protein n=1 Tax=Parapedobacter sp. DT-150 TaxID=3396162 RepID=UPI003F1B6EAC